MIVRHSFLSLAIVIGLSSGPALAQSAFPALPGESRGNASAFPPIGGGSAPTATAAAPSAGFPAAAAPLGGGGGFAPPAMAAPGGGAADACMKEFVPLREEAERRGKRLQAAGKGKTTPIEACKLFKSFSEAEVKMIKYVEANAARCGIPSQIGDQMKTNHKGTEGVQQKVCNAAEQMQKGGGPAAPSLSDVLGSSAALPEANTAKKGGSAFDTMTGNVLTR
ncbi:hypothetical protein ACQR1I_26360 [Bradyrhizobium sp. HKCCYLS2038]|uniref:hypothetical protein n=1 Tax=unclassified Bradyrhizobium TaxID=2631580 RepID=UPI003EBE68A0